MVTVLLIASIYLVVGMFMFPVTQWVHRSVADSEIEFGLAATVWLFVLFMFVIDHFAAILEWMIDRTTRWAHRS